MPFDAPEFGGDDNVKKQCMDYKSAGPAAALIAVKSVQQRKNLLQLQIKQAGLRLERPPA
jgi:hypothetical protein